MRIPAWLSRSAAVAVFGCATVAVILWMTVSHGNLVDTERFARPSDGYSVVDRHGNVLRVVREDGVDRRWVALRDVSPVFLAAVMAAEDRNFLDHHGIDAAAIARSAVRDVLPWNRLTGASTLTQQLVKLVYGRRGGLFAKAYEALRAIALERVFSKDEILEQYVNRIPFGDGIVGVERASEAYFGHPAVSLSVSEAALLAGIPQAPTATEPRRHLARALARRDLVLGRMVRCGALDDASFRAAMSDRPAIHGEQARPWEAPQFVDRAIGDWHRGAIERADGVVATTLDLDFQHRAETLLNGQLDQFAARGARNGAAVVVANATGEVLAYVGSARRTRDGGSMDLVHHRRQPGSSLKPFVYELLFERGGTAATVLDDVTSPMLGARGLSFEARDYDNLERGPVRARVALSASLNLAALDAARRVGAEALVRRFRRLGFRAEVDAERVGAAVVLGGLDVSPWELATAWLALARGGSAIPLTLAPAASHHGESMMTPATAAVVWNILSDARARADAFGTDLVDLAGGAPFALKTGTSTGWHDAWASVADDRFTVVVWFGDPSGAPMAGVSGFEAAAPIAARILGAARSMRDPPPRPAEAAASAASLIEADVCAWTGLRAGARCRHVVHELFAPGSVPTATCSAHDANGVYHLPARYVAWAHRAHPAGVEVEIPERLPNAVPEVVEPRDGSRLLLDPTVGPTIVALRGSVRHAPAAELRWEVDGESLPTDQWQASPGQHTIVALSAGVRSAPAVVMVTHGAAGRPEAP